MTTQTPLQEWFASRNYFEDPSTLIYYGAAKDQVMFFRDRVHPVLVPDYSVRQEAPPLVVGTHMSKSVTLPVYCIKAPNFTLYARDNFYDWKVTIIANKVLEDTFGDLIGRGGALGREVNHACYFEGFEDAWVLGTFADDQQSFSTEVYGGKFGFWTFCWLLAQQFK